MLLLAAVLAPVGPSERATAAARAVEWVAMSQTDGGWVPSLGVPHPRYAWMWDQALALLLLTPSYRDPAGRLVAAVRGIQDADGALPACVDADTGGALVPEPQVGAVGLMAFALSRYGTATGDAGASESAARAAEWLLSRQNADGSVATSTLANIAAWWGMVSNGRGAEARKLSLYLLGKPFERSEYWFLPEPGDRTVVCDVNTLGALLLSANRQYGMAASALMYVRTNLFVRSTTGRPGFGVASTAGLWYEGTAQYVAADGLDAGQFVATLMSAQNPDGSMPHSDRDVAKGLSWHTTAPSLSATVWSAFALQGHPFELTEDERRSLRRPGRSIGRRGGQEHPAVEQAEGEDDPWG